MCESTDRYKLLVALGKLEGLAGTIRYDLPEECRQELRNIAADIAALSLLKQTTN